jgi:hypothetical protein
MAQVTGPAVIGRETAQPNKPGESPSGSNSLTEHSAKAAAEDPYIALFKKVAAEVNSYLPHNYNENAKIAAVRACMGLTTEEKAYYLHGLQKHAADTTSGGAGGLPPGSRGNYNEHNPNATHSRPGAYDGRSANQGTKSAGDLPPFMKKDDDKKDDDKDEKKDDDKGGDKGGMPAFIQEKIDARKDGGGDEKKDDDKKDDDKKEASLRDYFRRIEAAQRKG